MRRLIPALLLLAACKKAPEKPPEPPARFCDQDLTGVWLNASDHHFAYRFRDHGDVIRGEFMERSDDGKLAEPSEPILFELHRTKEAVAGVMRSTAPNAKGASCPVEFGVDVTSCREKSLQAQVETEVAIEEDCRRKTAEDGGDLPAHRTEFVFVRDISHPSGGGETPDAH
ncbi:MAG: hypothetical protein ACXWLM_09175 [Myxococcales bacterium]